MGDQPELVLGSRPRQHGAGRRGVRRSSPAPSTRTTRGRTRTPSSSTARRCCSGWSTIGATPNVRRVLEAGQLGLSSGSFERTSLLALLRKCATTPSKGLYAYDEWENMRVAEGSATVALRMADELGGPDPARVRPCGRSRSSAGGCSVQLESGELVHGRRRGQRPAGRAASATSPSTASPTRGSSRCTGSGTRSRRSSSRRTTGRSGATSGRTA